MSRAVQPRRLATVLFLDIVDSTRIATELGDRRWRELLGTFRAAVRAELKRHRGHEEDTSGDGFFATFVEPAPAVRAAVAIVRRVQGLGLDVRCGLHFGECEVIEGRLGGIAVHMGSRIMSLAGPAEVLVSATVHDLVHGAEMGMEAAGSHELKGVSGSWLLWRLRQLDGTDLPIPVADAQGEALRAREARAPAANRRRLALAAGGAVALLVMAGGIALYGGLLRPAPELVTLVRIDPEDNSIALEVRDGYRSDHYPNSLWSVSGTLWHAVNADFTGIVRRDMETGQVLETLEIRTQPSAAGFGFGSIWMAGLTNLGVIDRWDAVSGRAQDSVQVAGRIVSIDDGPDAMWALAGDGTLFEIDPISNEVVATHDTPTVHPGVVVALGARIWVCDCEEHRLVEFDPAADRLVRTLEFPQMGFLVGLTDEAGSTTLWLLDIPGGTVTPIDEVTGVAGQPIGIGANMHAAAVSFGSVWVAAGDKVLRVEGEGPRVSATIRMPAGMSAGSIAADPETGSLWIGDCGCPLE